MERRYKDGVDYWNIDVDFFENKKIRLIRAEFGIQGVYIFILILNEIYRTSGYYKQWDNDDCLLMSAGAGVDGGCSPGLIGEVVQGLVRRSLFDKRVFDSFGVLTSSEIQRRFLRIVGNSRDSIPMIKEYFLLDMSSRKDITEATLKKLTLFPLTSKDNAENLKVCGQNLKDFDKEQNRKEQNRNNIGVEPASGGPPPVIRLPLNDGTEYLVSQEQEQEWEQLYPAVDIKQELREMRGWLLVNKTKRKTRRGIGKFIVNWLSREQDKGRGGKESGSDYWDKILG